MTTSYEETIPRRRPGTGVRLPDTTTDQAHKQLSKSYKNTNADSSSNGIIWNIETSLRKFSQIKMQ